MSNKVVSPRRFADTSQLQSGGKGAGKNFMTKIGGLEKRLDEQVDRYIEANKDADPEEIKKIRECFILFDKDLSGDLDKQELSLMYEKLGKPKNPIEVSKEIQKFDKNNTGTIDLYEFLEMSLGATASPFLKKLLFFKRLELQQAEEAARALSPRDAFLADRAKSPRGGKK